MIIDIRPNSACAVNTTMYVQWTCINRNRTDDNSLMISICIFEKNENGMFFLKKPSLVS